jgi:hypothetical protein
LLLVVKLVGVIVMGGNSVLSQLSPPSENIRTPLP